jgi:hypothetical protein
MSRVFERRNNQWVPRHDLVRDHRGNIINVFGRENNQWVRLNPDPMPAVQSRNGQFHTSFVRRPIDGQNTARRLTTQWRVSNVTTPSAAPNGRITIAWQSVVSGDFPQGHWIRLSNAQTRFRVGNTLATRTTGTRLGNTFPANSGNFVGFTVANAWNQSLATRVSWGVATHGLVMASGTFTVDCNSAGLATFSMWTGGSFWDWNTIDTPNVQSPSSIITVSANPGSVIGSFPTLPNGV